MVQILVLLTLASAGWCLGTQPNLAFPVPADDPSSIRQKATVRPFTGDIRSYSGFLSVDPKYDAKLFYWFFENHSGNSKAPLLVWMFGEVGRSSMLSVFEENGPYTLVKDKVALRQHSWTQEFNVLYLDSTVAAGYSSANSTAAYPRTTQQAADHLYQALKEFLHIYDSYQNSPIYLGGEYYAAKIVISLADLIRRQNDSSKVNLKKVCLGAGIIDPANQQRRAEFLYQMGVVDPRDKQEVTRHEDIAYKAMSQNQYRKAKTHGNTVDKQIKNAGYKPPVDSSEPVYDLSSFKATVKFLNSKGTREDLHAGNANFQDKPAKVLKFLLPNLYTSSSKELVELLNHYTVLMYTGQYDMVVPTSQYDEVIDSLPWEKRLKFQGTSRENWKINDKLVGYYKRYGNLCQVMVRQANHFVARTQPWVTMKALSLF